MDQQFCKDGKTPYGPIRYEEIVKERYLISREINTSYNDTGKLTPLERRYILNYIIDEAKAKEEQSKKINEMIKNKKQ